MTDVETCETCEQQISSLQDRLDRATAREQAIAQERQQLGYNLHINESKQARAQLSKLSSEMLSLAGEKESLVGALAEARKRLAAAQAAVEREAAKASAVAARAAIQEMLVAARDIDGALSDYVDSCEELFAAADKLHKLGFQGPPTANQLDSLGLRAVQSWIGKSRFRRACELLQPSARREMFPTVMEWASNFESRIKPLLGEQTNNEDKAA